MSIWGHIPTDRGSEMSLGPDLAWEIGSKFSDYCCAGGRDLVASRSSDRFLVYVAWVCWHSSGFATSTVTYSELLSSASKSREYNQCQMQSSDLIQVCVWPFSTPCVLICCQSWANWSVWNSILSQCYCWIFFCLGCILPIWSQSKQKTSLLLLKHRSVKMGNPIGIYNNYNERKTQNGISETKVIKQIKVTYSHLVYEHSGSFLLLLTLGQVWGYVGEMDSLFQEFSA